MSINIREDQMQHAEIFGKPVLFTNWLIPRDTVPDGWYCYDLRGGEKNPGPAATLEDKVITDHCGTVLSPAPLKRPGTAVRRVNGQFALCGELLDLLSFCEEHGLEYPEEKRKYFLRPATPEEAGLFYSDDENDQELACVGHLRLDFGHRGQEFWSTWHEHNGDELNVADFKAELDAVVNELRAFGPLKALTAMSDYCRARPDAELEGSGGSFGFIAETERYRYCLRCIPRQGDYNGYLYAYDKRQQELNMARDKRSGLTEEGRQRLRDAADPSKPHTYDWFVIERYGQEGERLHSAASLTGAIDRYNGLDCESKRLGVTKDKIATIDLVVTADGATRLEEGWVNNPRFAEDGVISEAAARLPLSIAGLEQPRQNMTFGGI